MTKHHGYHSCTRKLHKKKVRDRGLPGLSRFMVEYNVGDKVDIVGDSSFQKRGFPHRRFHGKTGQIFEVRGRCFGVHVRIGNAMKTIFIGKEHIRMNKSYMMNKQTNK